MAQEIERKYVVNPALLPDSLKTGPRIVQCYLTPALDGGLSPEVRVRLREGLPGGLTEGSVTIKIKCGNKMLRYEYEAVIASDDAAEIIKSGCGHTVRKMRSKVPVYLPIPVSLQHRFSPDCVDNERLRCDLEIDVFTDENAGLVIAELELPSVEMPVPRDCLPSWLDDNMEVTGLPQYSNRVLAELPYCRWSADNLRRHQAIINCEVQR